MRLLSIYLLLVVVFSVVPPISLIAQELFPAGSATKSRAMSSAQGCRGSSCAFYNPARVIPQQSYSTDIELGYLQARQSYEHPAFDPVVVNVRSPFLSAGVSGSLADGSFGYAFSIFPTAFGKQNINGLPRRIAGNFESLYVENESLNYDVALAAAYRFNPEFQIGLGLIRRYEKRKIFATRVGNNTPLIRYDAHNEFYIPVLGTSYTVAGFLDMGLSYRFAKTKTYKGTQKSATSDKITGPKNVNYDPAAIMFGFEIAHEKLKVGADINYLMYGAGKSKVTEGLTHVTSKADLNDIWERGIHAGYAVLPELQLGIAYAQLPSPWGSGHYSDVIADQVGGVDFGAPNNVFRNSLSFSAKYNYSEKYVLDAVLFSQTGKREIGARADRPGYYKSDTMGASINLNAGF